MVDIQTILTLLTLISVPIGVLYHIMTLNNQNRTQKHAQETRQAQLSMQLYSFYDNKEFLKDYGNITNNYKFKDTEDWWNKYSAKHDIEAYSAWLRVGRFFDGVGLLLDRKLVDKDLIFELLGDLIQGSWEGTTEDTGMGRWIQGTRDNWNRPNLWKHYETLYHDYIEWLEDH